MNDNWTDFINPLGLKEFWKLVSAAKLPFHKALRHKLSELLFETLIILHGKYRNCKLSKTEMFSDCYLLQIDVFLKHTHTSPLNKPVAISVFDDTKTTNISETKCMT